jgi:catechol 2,3-dioxygenase-like lactoylglutathione lyase family enzyme
VIEQTAKDNSLRWACPTLTDLDRAKRFYGDLGWRLDADFVVGDEFRVIQFTPSGSPCSVQFGRGVTSAVPGSVRGLYLVVSDIQSARAELAGRGVDVSEVFHRDGPGKPAVSGPRVVRGGSWRNDDTLIRAAIRFPRNINVRFDTLGFRVVQNFR